ncbi:MAG: cytochrome c oxidase subunit I [Aggregatilineales bacterium]
MATTLSAQDNETLKQIWQPPAGILSFFTAVNHRTVGLRYIITGLTFFILAGIAALLMRLQLMFPENTFMNAELYNQFFTMHGTTMMFLFAVPIMEGVGIYLVPLMIGTRDMAFPRLNAFGYYVFLISGIVLWVSLLFGSAPDGGWFAYTPLTGPRYSPGIGTDFYATLLTFLELAALVAAVELAVTILKLRAPGMSFNRLPIFVWAILVMSFMIMFAMPSLITASAQLALDRTMGTQFFNPTNGGDPLLWQHLFWFFGHPEVYIIFVPALGIVSTVLPTFVGRPIVGYFYLVLSLVAIGIVSFGLWVHHMFTTGLPILGLSFFTIASMMIAIPSGIQIFSSLATIRLGKPVFKTPLLYVLGFIIIFVIGGITGVMVAAVPLDTQVHDTYFVVAHFHYVLIGGAVFPLFAGLYYWFPKFTGKMLNERLGPIGFWLTFIGFNVTFFTMHFTGFAGMPRRVYTYLPDLGWDMLNLISTLGSFVLAAGIGVFFIDLIFGLWRGKPAGDNPWGASTLEWATTSPPQPYNFASIPIVHSRDPLWDANGELETYAVEPYLGRRETIGTSVLDARPEQRVELPKPTITPFILALATAFTFISLMVNIVLVPIGGILIALSVVAWHWTDIEDHKAKEVKQEPEGALPSSAIISSKGRHPTFWWGILFLILIEAVVFASLIVSYFYLRAGAEEWPPELVGRPDLLLPTINTVILLLSSIPIYLADHGIQRGNQRRLKMGIVGSFILGAMFVVIKFIEYGNVNYAYGWTRTAYTSIVWMIILYHTVHVITLLIKTCVVGIWAFQERFDSERNAALQVNGLYWHFVVLIWLPLYATIYLSPYVLGSGS